MKMAISQFMRINYQLESEAGSSSIQVGYEI